MIVVGYKAGADSIKATQAIKKHTGKSLLESKRLVEEILDGNVIQLPDDFVLREDLEDLGFRVS